MRIHGWGRYPIAEAELFSPSTRSGVAEVLANRKGGALISRGMGRSYGDSAIAALVLNTQHLNCLLDFDPESGIVRCGAGVTLADLLSVFVPRGWFLPVTPGTKFVSVGGAIASDVHGKNHHLDGCFSEHVIEFDLMLASGEVVKCSKNFNSELFRATSGGMGLTGIILEATLKLRRITSAFIDETTLKAANLEEALALFEQHGDCTYSVAWIDCLASGASMGRSLLMLGEHATDGNLFVPTKRQLSVPVEMPDIVLNRFSIAAFNALYYGRIRAKRQNRRVHYEPYFYPLDGILHWNRLYGKRGFTQYQFVIPKAAGVIGMRSILQKITASRRGSFLAVLKTFGKENENYLSFPTEGYTLALDFKLDDGLFELLDELDRQVIDYGGRVYLAKDVRLSADIFRRSYPRWQQFQAVRQRYGAIDKFRSRQSERLEL